MEHVPIERRPKADVGSAPHGATFQSVIFTLGHSTRPVEELIGLLREHAVELVVDVRRFPGSRRRSLRAGWRCCVRRQCRGAATGN